MKLHLYILFFAALCVALFSSASDARANAININFAGTHPNDFNGSTSNIDPGTTPFNSLILGPAGIDTSNNANVWNNVTGNTGTVGNGSSGQLFGGGTPNTNPTLAQGNIYESVNGTATSTGTTVSFNAFRTFANAVADNNFSGSSPTQNGLLLNNYLEGSAAHSAATVTVSNIPTALANVAGGYTVTVYTAGEHEGTATDRSDYTLTPSGSGGGTINPVTGPVYAFTQGFNHNGADATTDQQANFILFTGLSGTSFTLTANTLGSFASAIDGISISSALNDGNPNGGGGGPGAPEPGSIVLMVLGAFGLAVAARRRRARSL